MPLVKNLPSKAGNLRDEAFTPWPGRSFEKGMATDSGILTENPSDKELMATVGRVKRESNMTTLAQHSTYKLLTNSFYITFKNKLYKYLHCVKASITTDLFSSAT